MANSSTLQWKGNLSFDAEVDGFHFNIDTSVDKGGDNTGPRPKALLLAALSGCSGLDIVSILKKMRIDNYSLTIEADADSTDEHPKTYHTIRIRFLFTGNDLPKDKIINAVELSITKYCGVYAMLKQASTIKSTIIINQEEVWNA